MGISKNDLKSRIDGSFLLRTLDSCFLKTLLGGLRLSAHKVLTSSLIGQQSFLREFTSDTLVYLFQHRVDSMWTPGFPKVRRVSAVNIHECIKVHIHTGL